MKQLAPFITVIAILIISAVVIVAMFNYRLKRKILDDVPPNELSLRLLSLLTNPASEMLKWGIICLFGGMGLIALGFIPYDADSSPIPYGVEAVFIALGFLLYYFIERNQTNGKGKNIQ